MTTRFVALDAIRGIAAAVVVVGHIMAAGRLAIPVHWAVMVFFVLSGFVLTLPWVQGRPPDWTVFMIRRVIRLWPPVVVAVVSSAILYAAIGVHSDSLGHSWQESLTPALMVRCLLLTGQGTGCESLDVPLWSLVYEARISLFFPLLAFAGLRLGPVPILGALGLDAAIEVASWIRGHEGWLPLDAGGLPGIVATLHYATLFLLGIVLAAHSAALARIAGRNPGMFLAVALASLAAPSDTANGIGAAIGIATVLGSGRLTRWLMLAPLQWLGRVSYSLYLIHWPILLAIFNAGDGAITVGGGVAAFVLALVAADLMFRLVEAPAIRLGRAIKAPAGPAF